MMTNLLIFFESVLILGILICFGKAIRRHFRNSANLYLLLYLFSLIWIARFWVNYFVCPGEMSVLEKFFDSFVHTLQTFSMDEDYTSFTVAGKELLNTAGHPHLAVMYGLLISILNVCAPVMGGAIILDVLTGFFPRLRLWLHPRQRKFVFSELNEASIILAEDICRGDNYENIVSLESLSVSSEDVIKGIVKAVNIIGRIQKPFIIFTDAYADEVSEEKSELFDRAKALHAICIRSDMQFLSLSRSESVYYFFVDTQENVNIASLSDLLEKEKETGNTFPVGKNSEDYKTRIYLFCQSEFGTSVVNSISTKVDPDTPIIIRSISDYTNLAVNLLYEAPLFIPLLNKQENIPSTLRPGLEIARLNQFFAEKDTDGRVGGLIPTRDLHVTILGGGTIGEEILKAVYWCGQIAGVQLYIHVITKCAKELKNNLKSKCPELLESCKAGTEILKCYPKSNSPLYTHPYAIIDGLDIDADVEECIANQDSVIEKSDYFVVALGNDQKNITIAMLLKQYLARRQLNKADKAYPVIATAVFDKRLADSVTVLKPGNFEPYLIPFAVLTDRYSCRSVFMSDITVEAWNSASIYDKKSHEKRKKDEYSYWANVYRAIHAPYKMFAFDLIKAVDLSLDRSERYQGGGSEIAPNDLVFSWMEHRRWNACIRAQGFLKPTDVEHEKYYYETQMHKDLLRKYHNCLVESSVRGSIMPREKDFDLSYLDALDIESIKAYKMNCRSMGVADTPEALQESEYKHWDDYCNDVASQNFWKTL